MRKDTRPFVFLVQPKTVWAGNKAMCGTHSRYWLLVVRLLLLSVHGYAHLNFEPVVGF